jgi:hypothetical protein
MPRTVEDPVGKWPTARVQKDLYNAVSELASRESIPLLRAVQDALEEWVAKYSGDGDPAASRFRAASRYMKLRGDHKRAVELVLRALDNPEFNIFTRDLAAAVATALQADDIGAFELTDEQFQSRISRKNRL